MRVCAVLLHDGRLCLIRGRQRQASLQSSLPGGLVEDGDDLINDLHALALVDIHGDGPGLRACIPCLQARSHREGAPGAVG
ncbi:hypothetical protein A6A07_31305 [Streptomyces sp. CB03911]|nr:hypothetical protein A6A07_31305 [Streptomyces sp. CB03911]